MEIESATDVGGTGETRIAVHPLAIVHMSDQYTRISSGGSPLDKNAPVVGLLFGFSDPASTSTSTSTSTTTKSSSSNSNNNDNNNNDDDEGPLIQVIDADDIPVEISDASTVQVDLHKAVFPKHKVVGWYRVVSVENEDIEPTPEDLSITKLLKGHYSPSDSLCFCLLKVQKKKKQEDDSAPASGGDDAMKTESAAATTTDTLSKELPINLYELHDLKNTTILLGLSNWQLETSASERIAVERVMKERPSELGDGNPSHNPFVLETKAMQHSLVSMKDRVQVLTTYLEDVQGGKRQLNHGLLRQIQQIVCSLGPLSSLAATTNEGEEEDVQMLAHLAIVARTVNTIQSYTEKFRVMNERAQTRRSIDRSGVIY